jgi:hypothetical protein
MTPALSVIPGALVSDALTWGPIAVVAVFAIFLYRRGRPVRQEMRARPVTFSVAVDVQDLSNGVCQLNVHGDVFEVSGMISMPLLGQPQWYRASDTTMEVVPGRRRDWIQIASRHQARWAPQVRISPPYPPPPWMGFGHSYERRGTHRWMTRQIWDALVRAGVQTVGPPPQ